MKRIFIITGVVCLLSAAAVAAERSMLARVTVYWASGGSGSDHWTRKHQSATKVRLREGHCAVDPRKIPYGSKVILPDATLTAVDTGGHVKSRRASRIGRSSAQRNALVVDRFFETKSQALAWARKNPHFMKVRVVSTSRVKDLVTGAETRTSTTTTTTKVAANKPVQSVVPVKAVAETPVAPTPLPRVAAVAKAEAAAPRQTALRTSVPTARMPAPSASVAQPQAPTVASALPPAGAVVKPASTAPVATPLPTRLAANSSQLPTAAVATNGVMIHGPSHYRRAVAYMP